MSNYKLTDKIKTSLVREASRLLAIPVNAVVVDFPLSQKQVIAATTTAEARQCIEFLELMKANNVQHTHTMCAIVEASDEINLSVVLEIELPQHIMFLWDAQRYNYTADRVFRYRDKSPEDALRLPFYIDTLDETTRTQFVKWINTVTTQRRLWYGAYTVIADFIEKYCSSTGELLARWPGLKILFNKLEDPWPGRVRDTSRRVRTWGWNTGGPAAIEWHYENEKRMSLIDGLLAGAMLMADEVPLPGVSTSTKSGIQARVRTWDGGPT